MKTGADPDAANVNTRAAIPTSIAELAAIRAPAVFPANARTAPVELSVYSVEATLTHYRFTDDSDYHLVIADKTGKTMIVELPHPDCVAAAGVFRNAIISVRESFNARLRATTTYKSASIPVRVYGVGFFDSLHGQLGVAANGIELHPVLKIEFDIASGVQVPTAPTNQTFTGTPANDFFTSGAGNDLINGGSGIDTVLYSGSRADYIITKSASGFTVFDSKGTDGTDTLVGIERLAFVDQGLALDAGINQSAGQTALLLAAVLGKPALATKKPLVGNVIGLFDQGFTLQQLSGAIMRLPIWDVLTGRANPTNSDIAKYLLLTVNGVIPDANVLSQATFSLDTELGADQGKFLSLLSASSANQARIGFVALQQTGVDYQ